MEYTKFLIERFKGIKSVSISLDSSPKANVYALVGLNESGKSTVLEALSHVGPEYIDFKKEDPSGGRIAPEECLQYIPVADKHNFNGRISLSGTLRFSPEDKKRITDFLSTLSLKVIKLQDEIQVVRYFSFRDSKFHSDGSEWSLIPIVKKSKGKVSFELRDNHSEWQKLIVFVRTLMPKVLFFRNELFDIPDKIFIGRSANSETSGSISAFYKDVIQDVLYAIDPSLNVETHIVNRKKSKNASDKQSLDAVLEKMGQHMTRTVMQQWETIFNRQLREKSIRVVCDIDENGRYYLQIRLIDGGEVFTINQRSTGFRWFFVFILLTQYRGHRNESAIFLYDEPASNLHSSAQQQLLHCFSQLPKQFTIIYSTHSHYLIRPEWLESTYIVQNQAAIESTEIENISPEKTDIRVKKYRSFVSDNPNGVSFFQPILDVLRYAPSRFDLVRDAVFMEGKSDFYLISYMSKIVLKRGLPFDVIPCGGSGTVDQMICLYAGWGKNFLVLLDADAEGEKARSRYLEKFGPLVNDKIITYADIDPNWGNFGLEKVIGEDNARSICNKVFPQAELSKKNFGLAVQELLITNTSIQVQDDAKEAFNKIFDLLEERLNSELNFVDLV